MSVSPFRSSMSELRSFKIPAQSILEEEKRECESAKARPSTRQIITLIAYSRLMTCSLTVNQAVIYTALQPNHKSFTLESINSPGGGCSRVAVESVKINAPPSRAFTPQCFYFWVKVNLCRNKWLETPWLSPREASPSPNPTTKVIFSPCQSLHQTLNKSPLLLSHAPLGLHCTHLTFSYLSQCKRFLAFPSTCYLMPHSSKPS